MNDGATVAGVTILMLSSALSAQLLGCGGDGNTSAGGGGLGGGSSADGGAGAVSAGGAASGGAGAGGSASTTGGPGGAGGDTGGGGDAEGGAGGGGGSATGCVGPSGVQVGPVQISDTPFVAYYPVVLKASESSLAVAWNHHFQQSTSELHMQLIDRQTLEPLPGGPAVLSAGALYSVGSIRLTPSPSGFGLSLARTYFTTGDTECRAHMFDPGGNELGFTFDAAGETGCSHPSMVHDGTGWGLIHLDGSGIRLRFLEDTGAALSYQQIDSVASGSGAVSGFNPITQRYVAAYTQIFAGGDDEIVTAEINLAGTVLASGVRVSNGPAYSRLPEMVWNGAGFVAIWDDARSGSAETYFAELDGSGAPVGTEVAVVTGAQGTRIAFNGQVYGLTWRTQTNELHFKAVDIAGNDVGTEHTLAIDLPTHSVVPSLTWDGERFVVVWFQNTQGIQTEEIFAAAVCP